MPPSPTKKVKVVAETPKAMQKTVAATKATATSSSASPANYKLKKVKK